MCLLNRPTYTVNSLSDHPLERPLPISNHFVNNCFVCLSIFLCLDFSLMQLPPLINHFFLHQGWLLKREFTVQNLTKNVHLPRFIFSIFKLTATEATSSYDFCTHLISKTKSMITHFWHFLTRVFYNLVVANT